MLKYSISRMLHVHYYNTKKRSETHPSSSTQVNICCAKYFVGKKETGKWKDFIRLFYLYVMKNNTLLAVALFSNIFFGLCQAQVTVNANDGGLRATGSPSETLEIKIGSNTKTYKIKEGKIENCSTEVLQFSNYSISNNCEGNSIDIYCQSELCGSAVELTVHVCNGLFVAKKCDEKDNSFKDNPLNIPNPVFSGISESSIYSKRNRVLHVNCLAIEGKPSGSYLTGVSSSGSWKKKTNLHIGGSLIVRLENCVMELDKPSISLNEIEYKYDNDVSDLLSDLLDTEDESQGSIDSAVNIDKISTSLDALSMYLSKVYRSWSSGRSDLSLSEYEELKQYKEDLKAAIEKSYKQLNEDQQYHYSNVMNWQPASISLTPIALDVPNADEVEVELEINQGTTQQKYDLGTYRTRGGVSFGINGKLFVSSIDDRSVYTDNVVADSVSMKMAFLETDSKLRIGVGTEAQLSFRTGTLIRPTVNIGGFVPFDEDISPNFTLGTGLGILNSRVNMSISAGLTLGQIVKIANRYEAEDLNKYQDLTNETLSTKDWTAGYFIGIGVSYNVSEKED